MRAEPFDAMRSRNGSTAPVMRVMKSQDIARVAEVERESFSAAWPATAFQREISQNSAARYIVLAGGDNGKANEIIGFAGLWLMVDEAHVVTVAVGPRFRGKGYGRLLMHGLLEVARDHEMTVATLECRVSNTAARALYRQYGFYEVGVRPRYYSDNREDAVIMTTESLRSEPFERRLAALDEELRARIPGVQAGRRMLEVRPRSGDFRRERLR